MKGRLCLLLTERKGSLAWFEGEQCKFTCELPPGDHLASVFVELAKLPMDQLSHIYLSRGPGSFTGLRLMFSIAKSLAHVRTVPITTVNGLELASQVYFSENPASAEVCLAYPLSADRWLVQSFSRQDGAKSEETVVDSLADNWVIAHPEKGLAEFPRAIVTAKDLGIYADRLRSKETALQMSALINLAPLYAGAREFKKSFESLHATTPLPYNQSRDKH